VLQTTPRARECDGRRVSWHAAHKLRHLPSTALPLPTLHPFLCRPSSSASRQLSFATTSARLRTRAAIASSMRRLLGNGESAAAVTQIAARRRRHLFRNWISAGWASPCVIERCKAHREQIANAAVVGHLRRSSRRRPCLRVSFLSDCDSVSLYMPCLSSWQVRIYDRCRPPAAMLAAGRIHNFLFS